VENQQVKYYNSVKFFLHTTDCAQPLRRWKEREKKSERAKREEIRPPIGYDPFNYRPISTRPQIPALFPFHVQLCSAHII
jgi:hypothetical protein